MKQKEALQILKAGYNVFLTGCAGTGKTHLLSEYISFLKKKGVSVGVTASTGIAATHIGGVTIHSFSGMGILDQLTASDLNRVLKKSYLAKNLKRTQVLIIDEISMLSLDQLDIADKIIRSFLKSEEPFGGMQVVLCGDFFQLPPIKKDHNLYSQGTGFAYKSRAWRELDLRVCYLTEQHRHKEKELLFVLDSIRKNKVNEEVVNLLRSCYKARIKEGEEITKLYTHNINVDSINSRELQKLPGKRKVFYMQKRGPKGLTQTLGKNLLAPEKLELKEDAVVMFVKNNLEKGYVNGTLGRVVRFEEERPVVKTQKGRYVKVDQEKWNIEEDGEVKAEVRQLPLRLAWAITVHKSQGTTLDAAEIDLSRAFEPGMGYVALSRIRSLKGLRLMGLNKTALKASEEVIKMDKAFKKASKEDKKEFFRILREEKNK
jgi:ATP-dependent exoDNAse (exonuclease V) alpha subunit